MSEHEVDEWSELSVSFYEIVFASWSFEELTLLTAGMDAWLPRDEVVASRLTRGER